MKKRLTKCVAITAAISLAVGGWGAGGSVAAAETTAAESVSVAETVTEDDGNAEETISFRLRYTYIGADGTTGEREYVIYSMERGATYGDLFAEAMEYLPEDASTDYGAISWEGNLTGYDMDEEIPDSIDNYIYLNAYYEGKTVVYVYLNYYDENGLGANDDDFLVSYGDEDYVAVVFEENQAATGQDLMDVINSWDVPEMYEGLRFTGWSHISFSYYETLSNGNSYTVKAEYENCMIRYFVDPQLGSGDIENWDDYVWEDVFYQVVEVGDTITIPGSFDGYDNIVYLEYFYNYQAGDTITVYNSMDFWGYTQTDTDQAETPDDGTSSVTPSDDTDSGSSGADDNTADVPDDNTSADGTSDADGSTSTDDGSSPDTTDDGSSQASGSDEDGQASGTSSSTSSGTSAQTGDNSNIAVWFMLLAAGAAAAVSGIRRKKKPY